MQLRNPRAQPVGAAVGIAVQLRARPLDRGDSSGERAVDSFVRRELDDAVEAELALHLLDRFAGLVRDERRQRRPQEAVVGHSLADSADFFRQTKSAVPAVAAAMVARADLFNPA